MLLDALGAETPALAKQQALVYHPCELIGLRLAAMETNATGQLECEGVSYDKCVRQI